jgi:hypothetical protein
MKKIKAKALLLTIVISFLSCTGLSAQSPENGNYNEWNYSATGVFGLVKLQTVSHRSYYKLTKTDNQLVKVQSYNASGIVTGTTVIRFVNGKLSTISRTDRWGDTYEVSKLTSTTPGEYLLTRRNTGKNDLLPCKAAKYIYKNNLLQEIRYIGYGNSLAANSNGVAIIRYKRYTDKNRYSLVKEMSFYDETGFPAISSGYDCHKVVYDYDERANKVSEAYFGQDGEPLTSRFGGYKIKSSYNENDQLVRSETIGLNDERTNNSYGVSVTDYQYEAGMVKKAVRYNDQMAVTRASNAGDGIAIIYYEYDEQGNEVKRSYMDEYDKPLNNNSGYHMVEYTYNKQNMLAATRYFDKYKNAANDQNGIHRYSYVKDAKNNTIQVAFFDKYNTPVQDKQDEVYMRKYRYDESGRVTATSYWKDESTPMTRWDGYFEQVTTYNQDGQVTEYIYLDEKGNSIKSVAGFSKETRIYDKFARLSERKWLDGNEPVLLTRGMTKNFHSIKYYFDEKGRVSSLAYFDTNNKPIAANINIDGDEDLLCNRIEFGYQGNRVMEERLFNANSSSPFKVIDCIRNNYVTVSGITKGYKNQ